MASNDFLGFSFCILYRWNFGLCYFCTFDFNFNKSSAGSVASYILVLAHIIFHPNGLVKPAKLRHRGFVLALYAGAEQFTLPIIVSMVLANLRPCSSMSVAMIIRSGLQFSMRDFREWCGLPAVVMIRTIYF